MKNEQDDAHDEHDVNKTGGNVKREKPKQPKYDQNGGDDPKHVLISCSRARSFLWRVALDHRERHQTAYLFASAHFCGMPFRARTCRNSAFRIRRVEPETFSIQLSVADKKVEKRNTAGAGTRPAIYTACGTDFPGKDCYRLISRARIF
jgi:hypothetical protein